MKKVLFITTSFYPDPVVASVRTKEFCKWLPEFGWEPYVLTKDYGYRVSKVEFASAVNEETKVHYLNKFDSGGLGSGAGAKGLKAKVISFLGKYVLAPDVSVLFWWKQCRRVVGLVDKLKPDVVITTGPPHSIHLTGMVIKKHRPEVIWVADFRDEFRNGEGYKRNFSSSLIEFYSWAFEKKVYRIANGLVFAIPTHHRWVRLKSPEYDKKSGVIFNGPPFELDPRTVGPSPILEKKHLTVTVIGFNNAPESLVLAKAIARLDSDCKLKFIGSTPPDSGEIRRELGENVEFVESLPHNVVMDEIKKSDILVGILSNERSKRIGISSKMFEYLVMPVPILLLNPTRPDKRLFSDFYGVFLNSHVTVSDVFKMLSEAVVADGNACFERAIACYDKWNRKKQTHDLVQVIEGLM